MNRGRGERRWTQWDVKGQGQTDTFSVKKDRKVEDAHVHKKASLIRGRVIRTVSSVAKDQCNCQIKIGEWSTRLQINMFQNCDQ